MLIEVRIAGALGQGRLEGVQGGVWALEMFWFLIWVL